VLLGHNGAGKTTTISMLTGLLPPTSGDAIVYDSLDRPMSVNKDLHLVRKSLGICPQHDVLYPDLTVQEHLVLFAIVKGVRGSDEIDSAVNKQIRAIRLEKKRHTAAKALSGGQRRRLSVAIAMVGDSEVVLLDEPSSGLDPASRRVTWDMLRQSKKDRAIVLTTHFMDEADALGDRIAIMGHGELICCDTPLALKVRYGVGYTLSFDMGIPGNQEEEKSNVSRTELCDVVKKYVSNAVMTSSSAGELSFRLPTNASSSFPSLLEILENEHVRYGIETWGLSMTTLEEVFLSLTKRAHKKETTSKNGKRSNSVFNRLFRRSRVESSSKKKVQTKVSSSGIMNWFRSAADVHVRLEDDDDDDEIIDKETKEEESKISSSSSSSSTNTNNIAKSVWNVKSGSRNSTRQFVESLRKRWISAKRDMKGFFCLIVIPICTVALVLVILHLNVAPTGSSLTLYPDELFGDQNIVVGNSEITRSSRDTCRLIDELSSSSLVTNKYNNNAGEDTIDSVQLSVSPLLEEARSRSRRDSHWPRMGALVFNDTLRLNYEEFGELVEENPNIVSLVPETIFNIFAERAIEVGVPENLVNNLREELESGDNEAIASAFGVIIETGLLDFNSEMDLGNGLTARIELSDDHLHVSFPLGLTVLFNTTSSHSLPAIWNLAFEGQLLGRYDENAVDVPTPSFKVRSHAMPLTDYQNARIAMFLQLFAALFLLIPFSYLPASCAMFVVQERTCGSQHLQLVSGVSPLVYWVSTFVWDITQYFVVIIGCYLVMLMYGATAFVGSAENSFCTIITLLAYGLASIPMSYAYSFAFTRHASAQIAICLMNFVTGFVAIIAHFIMSQIPKTANVAAVLQKIFRFFPQYCLGEAMINLAAQDLYSTLNYGGKKSVFDWDVTGLPITYMLLEGIAMFAIVILLQYNLVQYFWERFSGTVDSFVLSLTSKSSSSNSTSIQVTSSRNRHKNHHDDVDVVKERKLANSDKGLKESAVCLRKLRKEYNRTGKEKIRKVAVQDLDLIVPRRQCMGFLGENGAGKSSTMKMLTGDIEKTSGHAYISGIDISTHRDRVRKLIGYCPQFDPLLPRMTARETLLMYARLKGMPEENLQDVVNSAILTLGLQGHGDKMVNGFSGGMKRKLSLGIALIGDPQVVFLDEPSSGMDPVSRRQMWEIIESAAKHRSVVLTSHHMEECEALCSKVAILVEGKLACVGAIQRLKARFGQGYHLFFRMRDDESFTSNKGARDLTARARVYVMNSFHGAHVVEQDGVSVKMWIPIDASSRSSVVDREKEIKRGRSDVRLSNIFRVMEKNMKDLGIAEYGISQPTLEQVFLEIHSQHKESGSSSSSGKKNSSSSVDDEDMVAITSGNDFHGDDDGSHHFV